MILFYTFSDNDDTDIIQDYSVNSKETSGNNSQKGTHASSKGSALPIAAVSVGLLAIGCVIFAVNKMTKR